ncbi:hypothetical protein [Bernardetia litoralis]|uniref:hypothetical protein n=1 Tax=Bernardetia litoralis TaxID=999 RepID=UPI0002F93BAD|nr:hypothetical protein [Bernardetia litoralis]
MQTLFKKYSVLPFLFFIIFSTSLFLSCDNKKEKNKEAIEENQKKEESEIDKTITIESSQFLENEIEFDTPKASETTQKKAEASYQEAQKVVSINNLKKSKEEKQNTYIKKIAQLTQLEYNKIAIIKNKKGLREIEKIIATLPENESKEEAQRLTILMRFNRVALSKEAKEYLLLENGELIPVKDKFDFYLDKYVEAAFLHSNFGEKIELSTKKFEKSKQIAEIISPLSFEKLAIIESQLGILGLHSAIINIPDFPQKEEVLKIISK